MGKDPIVFYSLCQKQPRNLPCPPLSAPITPHLQPLHLYRPGHPRPVAASEGSGWHRPGLSWLHSQQNFPFLCVPPSLRMGLKLLQPPKTRGEGRGTTLTPKGSQALVHPAAPPRKCIPQEAGCCTQEETRWWLFWASLQRKVFPLWVTCSKNPALTPPPLEKASSKVRGLL